MVVLEQEHIMVVLLMLCKVLVMETHRVQVLVEQELILVRVVLAALMEMLVVVIEEQVRVTVQHLVAAVVVLAVLDKMV
jgi:hypothetical protein